MSWTSLSRCCAVAAAFAVAATPAIAAVLSALDAPPAAAIVGGSSTRPSAFPWYAELPFCGGALIAPDRVATAAHCVAGLTLRDIRQVRLGSGAVRTVIATSSHPAYVRRALDGSANRDAPADDIAIVVLAAPVSGVRPLALRTKPAAAGTRALLLGGGRKRVPPKPVQAAANDESLRRATLAVISDRACGAFYRRHGTRAYRAALRPRTMLCAGDRDGRAPFASACTGDSGGPLAVGSTLAGIVSWGQRCGGDRDPTVFTDPSAYRAFLTATDPVLAPVSSAAPAVMTGDRTAGSTLTCEAPPWVREPDQITFSFDSYRYGAGRVTRQQGISPAYVVRPEDSGRLVSCVATGSNSGGFESSWPSAAVRVPAH